MFLTSSLLSKNLPLKDTTLNVRQALNSQGQRTYNTNDDDQRQQPKIEIQHWRKINDYSPKNSSKDLSRDSFKSGSS